MVKYFLPTFGEKIDAPIFGTLLFKKRYSRPPKKREKEITLFRPFFFCSRPAGPIWSTRLNALIPKSFKSDAAAHWLTYLH